MNVLYERWMEDLIFKETGISGLSCETLRLYQLKKIKETIETAKKSRYYRELLKNIESCDIKSIEDIKKIPFTTSNDLMKNPSDFLCVPLDDISRIVTLNTSGTTGNVKRIFFTETDIETTVEFFRYGMMNIVSKGQRVLILMSGSIEFSVGKLLSEGLKRAGCDGLIYGPVYDAADVLKTIKENHIDCIVGIPVQVFYLAKFKDMDKRYSDLKLKSILLSADYVPRSICKAVGKSFECPVYTHYGMTEMGYGGGVECSALKGYHMRDTDLYTEIVNPISGENVCEGEYGEVVFTTMRRCGMPLIRYKTGDIARFLPKECSCSNVFRRMDYVKGRLSDFLRLQDGSVISIGILDEIMFEMDNVLNFKAVFEIRENVLNIKIKPVRMEVPIDFYNIRYVLMRDDYFGKVIENNKINLEITYMQDEMGISSGAKKRILEVL